MREFLTDIALPTLGYLFVVVFCIGVVIFEAGVSIDLISNPVEMAWEDAQ